MGKRVTQEQLRPEMVLSAEIVDGAGRLLLPKGTALTEKHIRYCQMWGIAEVEIEADEGPDVSESLADDPVRIAAATAQLEPRLRAVDLAHPVIAELFRYAVRSKAVKA
ncbi:MAG: hypothetical protein FJ206_10025 [Gemmatimonadetes bacterium]|nr:hypothetical protein [Gemmatimonadota bacterium]